jgi:hypothetical protein
MNIKTVEKNEIAAIVKSRREKCIRLNTNTKMLMNEVNKRIGYVILSGL